MLRTGLLDLPEDVLVQHILGRLDFRDVLRCSMAERCFISSSARSRARCGRYRRHNDSVSSAERLERRYAWRSLQWKKIDTITLSMPCDMSDFIGGVFVQIENDKDKPNSSMTVVRAPSPSGGLRELAFEDIGVLAANMTFDPSQDLLAVIEHRGNSGPHPKITRDADGELTIHLRSLTSNQTHPLATKSVLRTFFQRGWSTIITSHNVQKFEIFDDMLALLCSYNYRSTHVSIWNWKSGEVVLERMLSNGTGFGCGDIDSLSGGFRFLSSRVVVSISRCSEGVLRRQPGFNVFSVSDPIPIQETPSSTTSPRELVHICTLLLPSFLSNYQYTWIYDFTSSSSKTSLGLVFTTFGYSNLEGSAGGYFQIISSAGGLLKYATWQQQERELGARKVPWQEWGPGSSRIILRHMESLVDCIWSVLGNRAVFDAHRKDSADSEPSRRTLFVDSGYHLLRDKQFPRPETVYDGIDERLPRVVTGQSDTIVTAGARPFAIDVESRLPYRSISLPAHLLGTGYMCCKLDAERIVMIQDIGDKRKELREYFF